ncbi:bromodomain adjacent to zinc finger domain protein 1a [Phtheirospermum japonicum]|uniref:Bromodomain adjacent to zinc finger domain protein 1a n=1 Tax=Phtheirospermum japonicum TaxID=374723 RepID=A0A830C6Z8_9LAMI|nr:bromodomain adjacent to zinc finger domain protein 1a [Phtheirospermum japonicum]
MPLYKRKPFALVQKPVDLNPEELIFQIQFTKEIFRDYNEYLKRINLYRKRVWTCRATGKGNLTYEEALVSEEKASKRIQNIPNECVAPILRDVQFSMLNLKDLVDSIAAKFQGPFSEGAELNGKKDGRLHPCKIVKVIEDGDETQYEVEWLHDNEKVSGMALLNGDELSGKNPPFSKRVLKAFIKDSTYRSLPWVLHDNIAKKHEIPTMPPEELKSKYFSQNGLIVCCRKRKKSEDTKAAEASEKEIKVYTRRHKLASGSSLPAKSADEVNPQDQSLKYPIDDLLVKPTEEDRLLTERPSACRDFIVPMDCVGDLLMVWDFCASFGRLLNLSPFSLEDFENSLCYKDSTPLLIVESYSTLLHLLVKDNGKFAAVVENKKRKPKITLITWTEYLCDFMETTNSAELSMHISTIKRGHYALLEVNVKLAIFRELIAEALETDIVRVRLDEFIEERQALSAARRDEALDEGKKRREEKERKMSKVAGKEVKDEGKAKSGKSEKKVGSQPSQLSGNSENEQGDNTSKKNTKKRKVETNTFLEDINNPSKREIHKLMKNEVKESIGMKSADERKEFLEREIEKRFIRTSPLGKDRDFCRYWFFRRDGRVFVENSEPTQWGYYQTKEELDALIGSLNPKGVRERALKKQLEKLYDRICSGLQIRSKEETQRVEMEEALVRRSTRVRAPPDENPALSFLKYVNKWKDI